MANLTALHESIKAIQDAFHKLENQQLTQEELESLVVNTKDLYEKAIVLRYKAYEEKIFGVRPTRLEEIIDNTAEVVIELDAPEPEIEAFELEMDADFEEEIAEEEIIEEVAETPAFDFSLFDDSVEEVKEEQLNENASEHISVTSTQSDDFGLHEEKITMEQVTITPTAESNNEFIAKYSKVDPQFTQQFGMSKLDTLIGSFGLNERLQYINELFDGSSDAFAEGIKKVDNQVSLEDALLICSAFANQYNWDLESETIEELVVKIKRRYA